TPEQQAAAAQVLNSAGQSNRIDWNTGVTDVNDPNSGGNRDFGAAENRAVNQGLAQTTGYTGDFGGGQFNEWLATQPQSVTNQVGQYLTEQGQAERANLYGWDRNNNGVVDGTEAPGVSVNPDGSYTYPGGYVKGQLVDPYTEGKDIYSVNPGIEGAPPSYAWETAPGGMLPAGAWPETFMDPITGVTTYWSAPPPGANGQWQNPQFLPWDVRNGGTGDPYTPWTEAWATQQANEEGNRYAYNALAQGGFDVSKLASPAASGSGRASPSVVAINAFGHQGTLFQDASGQGPIWNNDGFVVVPMENGLYWDTQVGLYRNQSGTFVNADGSPVLGWNGQVTDNMRGMWQLGDLKNRLGEYYQDPRNSYDLDAYNSGPIVGGYPAPGQAAGRPPQVTGAAGSSSRARGTTGTSPPPPPAGTSPPPPPPPPPAGPNGTETGTGLTPGTTNPYSFLLNIFSGSPGGTGTGTTGQSSYDPYSWLAMLNLGYGTSTYGEPTYQSSDPSGINYVEPNSQNVEFRSPFSY
ncbi:MAG: hypothetical protein AB7I33_16560, partial [Gemmatimonadales bacterium]